MTTARQKLADECDLELFRVICRAEEAYDSSCSSTEKNLWGEALRHLRSARPSVRLLMSEEDRKRSQFP